MEKISVHEQSGSVSFSQTKPTKLSSPTIGTTLCIFYDGLMEEVYVDIDAYNGIIGDLNYFLAGHKSMSIIAFINGESAHSMNSDLNRVRNLLDNSIRVFLPQLSKCLSEEVTKYIWTARDIDTCVQHIYADAFSGRYQPL